MRRCALFLLALSAPLVTGGGAAVAAASSPPLPAIERQLMCVTCKIPLNVAESPQAERERRFVAGLVARGYTEAQIKRTMVVQYGPSVLALPSTHGVDLAAYLVPLAAVLGLLCALAVLLPRWRRHARGRPSPSDAAQLTPSDSARLNADMARFD